MTIETHQLPVHTLDGLRLDADLGVPADARAAAVICHPHPRFGGNRFNAVVDTLYTELARAGVVVLRFDFRGVGDSEGTYGDGIDERLDVAAAIEQLALATDAPLWLVGYSFGAFVGLDVVHPRLEGWLAVAPPLAMSATTRTAGADHRPKHLLLPEHDQFGAPADTEAQVAGWTATHTTVLASADHFLAGRLQAVADWAVGIVSAG